MLRDVRIVRLRCAWCLTRTNHLDLRVEAHLHSWQRPTNLSQLYRLGYQTELAVPMVRRRRSKNTGIRGLFYTYAIFIFSIRLGFGYILKQVLCQEHSWFAVGIFRPLEARSSASRQKISMGALVTVCSWNTNEIMVLPWTLWSPYALGTRTQLWFWHGCTGHCSSWNPNAILVLAWMHWSLYALGTRMELWFWHGCSGHRTLSEPKRNYGVGMDAVVTVCSWAWMRWSPNALGTPMELWLWRGCSGHRMTYDLETRTQFWFGHVAKTQATALHPPKRMEKMKMAYPRIPVFLLCRRRTMGTARN